MIMSIEPSASVGLELVEDDFTEEDHRKMDQNLVSTYSLDTEPLGDSDAPHLLLAIRDQLGDRASGAYRQLKDFKELIQENPVLLDMLKKGAQQGFKSLRCLKILRNVIPLNERTGVEPLIKITAEAAQRAWNSEYQGAYARVFRDNINALPRTATHANCIPIIQSSGYGKSRMVDELAKLVFTIPLNIRRPGEHSNEKAYPPSDADVWQYLCTTTTGGVNDAEKLVAWFLSNLFLHVATEVQSAFPVKRRIPQDTFARQWREHLLKQLPSDAFSTNRSQLYKKVVVTSREPSKNHLNREELFTKLRANLRHLLQVLAEYPSPDESDQDGVQIVLYFDEAHELARDIGGDKKLYDAVWSILAEFQQPCVFTIFLSTQSSMPLLGPSSQQARSTRQQDIEALWGPVTETPFDCHPAFPLQPGQFGSAEVSQLTFMIRLGRPLFWTMFERQEEVDKPHLLNDMMKLARKKLLCVDDISSPASSYSLTARIAILDVLITIDYEPRRESAHTFEMKLVASHMRTAFSIPYHRTYLRSGYPSEPFIAEAASRQMHHFTKTSPSFRMVDDLKSKLAEGLIDLGQKGEVVARLLLRKAYMDAIVAEQKTADPNFSRGCNFVGFLGALLAQPYDTEVQQLEPDNIAENDPRPKQPLATVFEHAVVRFTHFAKAADEAAMTTRGMVMGFLRGAAIIGWNSQKCVDIAIPILMNRNDKIEETSMSALLIQVKRRHQRGTPNAYIIDATKLDFFTEGATKDSTPYVTLIAELGAKPRASEGNVRFDEPPEYASPRTQKPRPRYTIWAYECTHQTWKVIVDQEDDSYREILALDDLFGDHARQDAPSLDIVHRMLPSWEAKPAWFSDESGKKVGPISVEEQEERGGEEGMLLSGLSPLTPLSDEKMETDG